MADDMTDMYGAEEGGYVDDDIDLDDDMLDGDEENEDEKLHTPTLSKPENAIRTRSLHQRNTQDANSSSFRDPQDYALSLSCPDDREFVVARFLSPCPDLSQPARMRALRDKEESVDNRREAIKADRKQHVYYGSHLGKKRLEVRLKQGYTEIPDRDRKAWTIDIYNPSDPHVSMNDPNSRARLPTSVENGPSIENERHSAQRGAHAAHASNANNTHNGKNDDTGSSVLTDLNSETNSTVFDKSIEDTRQFVGSFEGKSSSRYAMLLVDDKAKTAKLTPVGPHAWFSFRQKRGRRPIKTQTTESAERAYKKRAEVGMTRISKFHENAGEAQAKAELGLGSMTAVRAKRENAKIGIFRGQDSKRGPAESGEREGLDFEEEFDNDDVAQVDKEEAENPEDTRTVDGDAEVNAKKFRKMIKDEDTTNLSRPLTPGSDSDEEGDSSQPPSEQQLEQPNDESNLQRVQSPASSRGSHSKSPRDAGTPSRSATPTGHALPPRAPNARVAGGLAASAAAGATGGSSALRPGSSRVSTPMISSPSSSSAPGTPLRQEYAHLLPPPGQLPNSQHVTDVLSAMLRNRGQAIPLKEFTRIFERDTPEQKQNLASIMKQVAQLTVQEQGSRIFYVSLRSPASS